MSKRDRDRKKIAYTNTKKWVEESDRGFVPTLYKMEKGLKNYRFKVGKNYLDFMPHICGVSNPNAKEGKVHWECTINAHSIPTPDGNRWYACTGSQFNKPPKKHKHPCGFCKGIAKLRQQGEVDDDTLKKMEAKTRRLFVVINTKDRKSGYQILHTGHFKTFGAMLTDELAELDEDSPKLDFFHLEDGLTLEIPCKSDSYEGRGFVNPRKVNFEPRKKQYESSILEEVPCLDSLIIWPSEDEAKELFESSAYGGKVKKGGKDDDEDEDEEDDEDEEEDTDEDDSDDNDEDEDDEEDEKSRRKKKSKDEDDDDEDSDGDDEDESDDDDDEDDSSDDDSDDDEDETDLEKGDYVMVKIGKKKKKGKVKKVNKKSGIILVSIKGKDRPIAVDTDECTKIED